MKKILFLVIAILISFVSVSQPKVVAHRGYWDIENGAHNSLSSLYRAAQIEAYGSEFDVWMTSEGELVVFHDETINEVLISSAKYSEIRDMTISNGELLPTLDNFLVFAKNFPGLRLVLEIKSNIKGEEYAAKLAKTVISKVEAHGLAYRTDYIAFSLDLCRELAKLRPDANIAYLMGNKEPADLKKMGINGIDYHQSLFFADPDLVRRAHEEGLTVNVWTVNDPEKMRELIKMGVDYITTDKPELLQEIIDEMYE